MKPHQPGLLAALTMIAASGGGGGRQLTLPSSGSGPRELDEGARDRKRAKRAERMARRLALSNRKLEDV